MHKGKLSRRQALAQTSLLVGAAMASPNLGGVAVAGSERTDNSSNKPFRFCLNTATIRGQKLGIVKEVEIAAEAGYDGLEPWVDSIQEYTKGGGSLSDLRKRIADSGLTVEGAIGFPEWIVDDDARRSKGMERARREMELVAQIAGKRFAA